jgi:beta-lactamase class A
MTYSDNTAANLLLASVGGPAAITAYARLLGDRVTRLDRIELEMNEVGPGDPRDTTSPDAMLENVRNIVLGNALSLASRERMIAWLLANTTGDDRLRAGVPKLWRVGDKTGTGPAINNAVNDIAVIWPPHRAPLIVTAYYAFSSAPPAARERVLAKVAAFAIKV